MCDNLFLKGTGPQNCSEPNKGPVEVWTPNPENVWEFNQNVYMFLSVHLVDFEIIEIDYDICK